MKRIQFYVDENRYREIIEYSEDSDYPIDKLALHALRQYMRRYPVKGEDKIIGHKERIVVIYRTRL